MSKKSELETLELIKKALNEKDKKDVFTKKGAVDMINTFGMVKRAKSEGLFKKVGFNRYVLKGEVEPFYKIEEIDGEEYFVIVKK